MGLKNKKCMWLYLISMICIIVSTYAAKIIAPSLDFIGYSLMRPFFTELITALLWIVEIWVICHIYSKKMSYPHCMILAKNLRGMMCIIISDYGEEMQLRVSGL